MSADRETLAATLAQADDTVGPAHGTGAYWMALADALLAGPLAGCVDLNAPTERIKVPLEDDETPTQEGPDDAAACLGDAGREADSPSSRDGADSHDVGAAVAEGPSDPEEGGQGDRPPLPAPKWASLLDDPGRPVLPDLIGGVDWNAASLALAMLTCPYYNRAGICDNGCTEEPRCITDEPSGGWPDALRGAVGAPSAGQHVWWRISGSEAACGRCHVVALATAEDEIIAADGGSFTQPCVAGAP